MRKFLLLALSGTTLLLPIEATYAQGVVGGIREGAADGQSVAGPVGGVVGGAVGAGVGAATGALGLRYPRMRRSYGYRYHRYHRHWTHR